MPVYSKITFTQLAGKKRVLELADHAAPHGRPRQGPVLEDGVEVRNSETYYSGDVPPTRHLYGVKFPPWELDGRFSDVHGGRGFAKTKTEECRAFVADQQEVRIIWGDLVAVRGLIENFLPGRESWGEVPWTMRILISEDEYLGFPTPREEPERPGLSMQKIWRYLKESQNILESPGLKGSVFDALGSLISSLNAVWASTLQIADEIDELATAPFALILRFRAGLRQVTTAIGRLRATYDQLLANAAMEHERAQESQGFMALQSRWDAASIESLRELFDLDRQAERAQAGQIKGQIVAVGGDTWESMARRAYGDGTRAGEIRDVNGVEAGQNPQAGVGYLIPV
jgi:hypothetical protein